MGSPKYLLSSSVRSILRRLHQRGAIIIGRIFRGGIYSVRYVRTTLEGDTYFVPIYASHRPAVAMVITGKFYEPDTHALVGKLLYRISGDLIHAGTFFGDMIPSFSQKCKGKVYAFEPVLENYILANLCLNANNIENVILMNAALGPDFGIARIDTGVESGLHHGGGSFVSDKGQITSMFPIDALATNDVAVIQLDVEGFELSALQGAVETIRRCHPVILIEDNHGNCGPFLTGFGYEKRGDVPGLTIWSTDEKASSVREALNA